MSSPAPTQLERPSHTANNRPELLWSREAFGRGDLTTSDSEFEYIVINRPCATTTRPEQHSSSPSNPFQAVNDPTSVNGVSVNAAPSLRNPSPDDPSQSAISESQSEDSDADDEEEDEEKDKDKASERDPPQDRLSCLCSEGGGDHFRRPTTTTSSSHAAARTSAATSRKRKLKDRDEAATALENERIAASVGSVNKLAPKERAVAQLRVAGMDGGRDGEMAVRAMMDVDGDEGKRKRKRSWRASV